MEHTFGSRVIQQGLVIFQCVEHLLSLLMGLPTNLVFIF
jgi:hypothetical protein